MAGMLSDFRNNLPSFTSNNGSVLGLWREMDRLFEDLTRGFTPPLHQGAGFINPAVDISEDEKGLELKAELPGLDRRDIDIEYSDGTLTLRAERKFERDEKDEKKHYHLVERASGTYLRRFRLPFEPDPGSIEASYENGVLRLRIPRPDSAKVQAKKIEVGPPR